MTPATRVTLIAEDGLRFFGEGPCRLLRGVQETGSLRAAAGRMGLAYTKALKILRRAEEVTGYPLVISTVGGKGGGGSVVSPEGLTLLEQYERFRDTCRRENARAFRDVFRREVPQVAAVIMASGLGKRFQQEGTPWQNKLLQDFCGAPLLSRILDSTDALPLSARAVVTRDSAVAEYTRQRGIHTVLHDLPHRSDTVRLGLERVLALSLYEPDGVLFCPGDQPLLRQESMEALIRSFQQNPDQIHRLCYENSGTRIPGAPVLFPKRLFEGLLHLPQGKGGSWLIKQEPDQVVYIPVSDPEELSDADTPAELARLAALAEMKQNQE